MSVDTTNLRSAIARARALAVPPPLGMPSLPTAIVSVFDLEAVLVELDYHRAAKRSADMVKESSAMAKESMATVMALAQRLVGTDTEIELPNGQDASIGRTTEEPAQAAPSMDFLVGIQEALSELMMKDAHGNRPHALLEWHSDMRKTAAWAIITAIQDKRIPGLYVSVDPGFWGRACAGLQSELASVSGKLDSVKGQRDRFEEERDNLKRENLELRSRTVFPKAALAAKLAELVRLCTHHGGEFPATPNTTALINALYAYEKEDAEYPFVPADCDVRRVMIDIVPGTHGEGVEIYAKSVKEVEEKLAKVGEQLEDAQEALKRRTMSVEQARKIAEGGHDFGPTKEHHEKLASGAVFCLNLRWPWGVHWQDGVTSEHFGTEQAALKSIADMKEADKNKLSSLVCTQCGIRHPIDEFAHGDGQKPGDTVIVVDSDHKLFGWEGEVESWSQYGSPITYRVIFGRNRDSFYPCQLRKR